MDILEFAARSEWPVVAATAIWLVRKPIARMLDRVNPTKLDAWGLKAEFEKRLDKVDLLTSPPDTVEDAPRFQRRGPKGGEGDVVGFMIREEPAKDTTQESRTLRLGPEIVNVSPGTWILQSWITIERSLRRAADKLHPRKKGPVWLPPAELLQVAAEIGLTADEIAALKELRALRNQVAHEDVALTFSEAERYYIAVQRLLARIEDRPKPEAPA
jgi:hypothetical protein